MRNHSFRFAAKQSASPLAHPVLAIAMLGALLAGCGATVSNNDMDKDNNAMMEDANDDAMDQGAMKADDDGDGDDDAMGDDDEAMMERSSSSMPASQPASEAAMVDKKKAYADGTYTADGTYRSPAGQETVKITLELKDGVVAAASMEASSPSPKSTMFQGKFSEGLTAAVVGKSIDDLNLTVVNGSSLTPIGFMDALAKIKLQAAA